MVFDGLAVIVLLIGAIVRIPPNLSPTHTSHPSNPFLFTSSPLTISQVYAAKLGVHSCTAKNDNGYPSAYVNNPITNGGSSTSESSIAVYGNVKKQCQMAQADDAFMFFALVCFMASLVFDLFGGFRRRKSSTTYEA